MRQLAPFVRAVALVMDCAQASEPWIVIQVVIVDRVERASRNVDTPTENLDGCGVTSGALASALEERLDNFLWKKRQPQPIALASVEKDVASILSMIHNFPRAVERFSGRFKNAERYADAGPPRRLAYAAGGKSNSANFKSRTASKLSRRPPISFRLRPFWCLGATI
jgi:hypothetical protein